MLKGYVFRKSFKIADYSLSIYFKDDQAEAFISLLDIVRAYASKVSCCNTRQLIYTAGEENCNVIKTSANYELKVCNVPGFRKVMTFLENEDEAAKIVDLVISFIRKQKTSLPGPVKDIKTVAQLSFGGYFSLSCCGKKTVRYLEHNGVRWFNVQDVVRLFNAEAAAVEDEISKLCARDKLEVTLKNGMAKLCISSSGLKQVTDILMPPDIAKETRDALLRDGSVIKTSLPDNVTHLVVDGENSDILRYATFNVNEKCKVTVLRYNKNTFVPMYSVIKAAVSLGAPVKAVMARAKRKNIRFVADGDIFLPIKGLKNVLEGVQNCSIYCAGAEQAVKQNDIIDSCLSITSMEGRLSLVRGIPTEDEKEEISVDTRHFKPIKTSGNLYVIDYCEVDICNHKVLCCFAKADVNNPDEKAVPLFWVTHLGYAFDIREASRIKTDDNERLKASIPDIRKFNIKVVTMKGVEQLLRAAEKEEVEKLMIEVQDAVNKAYEERKRDIDFMIEKYETRRNATVKENKQETKEEAIVEEAAAAQTVEDKKADVNIVRDVITIENFVSYTDKQTGNTYRIEIAGSVDKEHGLNIFYNLEQAAGVFNVNLSDVNMSDLTAYTGLNGKTLFVTLHGLVKALAHKVPDVTAFVKDLFDQSRTEISGFAKALGVNLKDDLEQKTKSHRSDSGLQDLLKDSSNARSYVMGAIILAERYREALLWLKLQKKKEMPSVPGPKDKQLLDNLWKFIDCQDPDHTVSFGFQRQVIAVSERYQRLRNVIGSLS